MQRPWHPQTLSPATATDTAAKIREGMVAVRVLDGIAKNVYNGNPGTVVLLGTTLASPRSQKHASWVSAKHVEKDPTPSDEETP